jgi:Fic family protein
MLYQEPRLDQQELEVIGSITAIRSGLKYRISSPPRWYGLLRRNTFARAIRGSNSIEGINVSVEDAIAAAGGEAPEEAEGQTWQAIVGYRNAMTYVLQLAKDPRFKYSEGFIRSLHYMMLQYDLGKNPGNWRAGQIFVRDEARGEIVYTAPDAEMVPELMDELILTLNQEFQPYETIVKAAMAHLNLVLIHPFSDGNGRMARGLQTLVLARQGILEPEFCSIEEYLGRNTQDYYNVLAQTAQGKWFPHGDTKAWIRFTLLAHYRQAATLVIRARMLDNLWNAIETEVKKRGLPERVTFALADAAIGYKVRNSMYRSMADISENLSSRDLKTMVDMGLLVAVGNKRGRAYVSSPILKEIRQRVDEPRQIDDPFAPKGPKPLEHQQGYLPFRAS